MNGDGHWGGFERVGGVIGYLKEGVFFVHENLLCKGKNYFQVLATNSDTDSSIIVCGKKSCWTIT